MIKRVGKKSRLFARRERRSPTTEKGKDERKDSLSLNLKECAYECLKKKILFKLANGNRIKDRRLKKKKRKKDENLLTTLCTNPLRLSGRAGEGSGAPRAT